MADVLCIGVDDAAMKTRKLILEKAGHTVTSAHDLRKIRAACASNAFSVAVLGQSLNPSEKMRISDVVRTYCKTTKILELHTGIAPEFAGADGHLQVNANPPAGLVEAVNGLLKRARKAKAR